MQPVVCDWEGGVMRVYEGGRICNVEGETDKGRGTEGRELEI